ncbi:hypothetical protein Tco_0704051 [Tanacetum coccineum]|uniref:Tf2-1-like SH3-like domain-containing protein n=1 Tax=Tanacetum coccineum TaxID=301880 RepID=A0ABQ4Y1K1_9ASTR
MIRDCDFYENQLRLNNAPVWTDVENIPSFVPRPAYVPTGSRNRQTSVSADRPFSAGSRNRPTSVPAERPFPAGRQFPTSWNNPVARPMTRPKSHYFQQFSRPGSYNQMDIDGGRWRTAVKTSAVIASRYESEQKRPWIFFNFPPQLSLIPLSRGSFDVIVGIDWLSKRKFVIVCYEKVVRIPLEGDEKFRVHGERTLGAAKALMNAKVDEPRISDIPVFRVDLVPGATPVAKSPYRLAPLEMQELSEQLQELQDEELELLRNKKLYAKSSVKDKILATSSETSKVENTPAEMLRDLDQQMEKRVDDGKANVVTDALSRKERVKPRRVRAMANTNSVGVRGKIMAAQSEAFSKRMYAQKGFMGMMRTVVMDEVHASRYLVQPGADKDIEMDDLPRGFGRRYKSVRDTIGFEYCLASSSGWTKSPVIWAEIGDSSLTGPELVLDTTHKVVLIKEKLKAARDRQKSYADKRHKPLEFEILERIGPVAYRLRLPEELSSVHDTFHVSNLKKCLADANLHVPLNEIKIDKTLRFVEELVEIMDREIRNLKRSKIPLVKVHWNSKRGPEFTWEREDHMKSKYPQLFVDRAVESAS